MGAFEVSCEGVCVQSLRLLWEANNSGFQIPNTMMIAMQGLQWQGLSAGCGEVLLQFSFG